MATDRPVVHLICTAHLDPVWMWPWEEGAREAISTFRTAANLLEAFPEFVFNHNESLLYEWIEAYDPPLFANIETLVKTGRWNISGGWYLQPDCNMPAGETLVRVILEGRRYFDQKFGVRPNVAYNFDTFGHPGTLPQILKQSGFDLYIHCRPIASQLALPAALYRWRGPDNTDVLALRPDTGWYGTPHKGQAQEQAQNGIEQARQTGHDVLVTWGLGNHGGGATRDDLLAFRDIIAQTTDVEVRHSTPEAYLARVQDMAASAPVHVGELQRTLMGTYTSIAPVKRKMRQGESLLAAAERWATIAWWRYGWRYPADELRDAWKQLMFNTFHDILCGSSLEAAMPGVYDKYGHAHDAARRISVRSQHAMLPTDQPTPDTVPIYVLNPHTMPLKAPVGLNILSAYAPPPTPKPMTLYDADNVRVTSQTRGGSSVILDDSTWQPFVGFVAEVPPMSARRYEIRFEEQPTGTTTSLLTVVEDEQRITIENTWWQAEFCHNEGALVRLINKQSQHQLLNDPIQLFAMHDEAHAWGGEDNAIYNVPVSPLRALDPADVGNFVGMEGHSGPAVRIIAQGDVWITVECLVGWQHTRASLQFTFYAELPYFDLNTRLYMQARRKMIKLVFPFDLPGARAICEVPYGVAERPTDATEYPYNRWIRLESSDLSVGVANDGQYGFDVSPEGRLNLSISRGGVHCSWLDGDIPIEKSYTFMDQEQIDTHFRVLAGQDHDLVAANMLTAALALNQPLERFFTYFPPTPPDNAPDSPAPFLMIEPETVVLGALKKAENDDALIVRLVEAVGRGTTATLYLEDTPPFHVAIGPHQIMTFKVVKHAGAILWQPCNLLEEDL